MEAYSETTGTTYPNWDALVEAEANGYVAGAIISDGKRSWPWIIGPYSDKADAERARSRLSNRCRRQMRDSPALGDRFSYTCFVRPAWKDPR